MFPSKNHQFLIKVFYEVVKKNQNSVLLLIGRGSEIENIKNMVSELHLKDHVFFLGVREDIPDLLNLMDVFIFPSLYEGLGIVGIEAQATGLPCFFSEGIVDEAIVYFPCLEIFTGFRTEKMGGLYTEKNNGV